MTQRDESYSEPVEGQAVYACMSVESLPVPYVASEKSRCDGCGRETWFDPWSFALAQSMCEGPLRAFVQCERCGERWMRALPG